MKLKVQRLLLSNFVQMAMTGRDTLPAFWFSLFTLYFIHIWVQLFIRNSSAFGFLLQASSHAKPLRGGLMHL
ncbi:MAG: hypothetical protein K2N44_03605, partial [Lachnospiraceae bacterium]|nr:hypothetical protein [Lachnospiraceae bacterium]